MSPINPQSETPPLEVVQARLRALIAAGMPFQRIADAGVGLSWATVKSYAEGEKARPQARVLAQLWAAMDALSQTEGQSPHTASPPQPNPGKGSGLSAPSGDARDGALWALAAMHETLAQCYRALAAGGATAPAGGVPVAETLTALQAGLPPELRPEAPSAPTGRQRAG